MDKKLESDTEDDAKEVYISGVAQEEWRKWLKRMKEKFSCVNGQDDIQVTTKKVQEKKDKRQNFSNNQRRE